MRVFFYILLTVASFLQNSSASSVWKEFEVNYTQTNVSTSLFPLSDVVIKHEIFIADSKSSKNKNWNGSRFLCSIQYEGLMTAKGPAGSSLGYAVETFPDGDMIYWKLVGTFFSGGYQALDGKAYVLGGTGKYTNFKTSEDGVLYSCKEDDNRVMKCLFKGKVKH